MGEFTMPALGADMTEGTLVEWLVGPGDQVRKGDIVAVVDTTKSAIEVECFETGTVDRLLVETGTTVPVGAPLAVISPAGAPPETPAGPPSRPPAPAGAPGPEPAGPPPAPPSPPAPAEPAAGERAVASTPLVRHLAEDAGVDLSAVHGTGSGGRITRADVEREAAARPGTGKPGRRGRPGREGRDDREDREDREDRREGRTARVRATPLARRLAKEEGIDLASLTGSGREGAVRAGDVRAAAQGAGPGEGAGEGAAGGARVAAAEGAAEGAGEAAAEGPGKGREGPERYADMRRTTADLMARAKREIPHYYLSTTVDLGTAVAWLRERNRELPVGRRLLTTAVLLKATALAARQVPDLNGFWTDDGGFDAAPSVHLGVAVSLRGGGLVSAALLDAADLPLPDLMARLRDVVARARGGRLRASESTSATITVTNLGDQGVEAVFGVIHPPQVALVGLGRVVERPWAVNGLLGVRPLVTATLSADHRASDGATGARFLAALDAWAQKPEEL